MSRKFTHVEIFADMSKGHIRLTASAMNHLRFLSLQKAKTNSDDSDVVFNIHDLPVHDKDKPSGCPMELWMIQNFEGMKTLVRSCFINGVDTELTKLGIQEIAERVKKHTGCDNEKAFNMATKMMEHKNRPATHVLWLCNENSPSFMKFYVRASNNNLQAVLDSEENKNHTPELCCLESNDDPNIKPEDFLGNSVCTQQRLESDGTVRNI